MNKYDDLIIKILRIIIITEIIAIIVLTFLAIITGEKKKNQKNFLENRNINEIIPVYPDDNLMAKKYFADFSTLALNEPEKAYEYVDDYYKEKVYTNIDAFKKGIEENMTEAFINGSISSYQVTEKNDYRLFYIKDSDEHEYLIKEYGIMNYKIYLDINHVDIKN